MVGTHIPESRQEPFGDFWLEFSEEARRRVRLARHIWYQASVLRRNYVKSALRFARHQADEEIVLGPLKVGGHFLPRATVLHGAYPNSEGAYHYPLKHFLEQVIGLRREDERMPWWRAFLTHDIRIEKHIDRWSGENAKEHPEWCEPEEFPVEDRDIEKAYEEMRLNGVPGDRARLYALAFRKWRLGMKSPTKKAPKPCSLEEAVKKGLAEEASLKSGELTSDS